MGLFSKLTAPVRRLFTGRPSSITPESHVAWLEEQVKNYASKQFYNSPLSAGLNFTGETWEMRTAYRRFAFKEPAIKAPILKKVLSVASLDPTVKPAKGGGELERRAATFLDETISESEGGWPGLLYNVAMLSIIDGFSLCEKVFRVHVHGDKRGKWGLARLAPKDTEYLRFNLDEYRHITEIRNTTAGQGGMLFEPSDFVLYTHLPILGNPFGVSDCRAANRAANLIEAAVKLRSMLLENYSGPFLAYKRGSTVSIEDAKAVLSQARNNGSPAAAKSNVRLPALVNWAKGTVLGFLTGTGSPLNERHTLTFGGTLTGGTVNDLNSVNKVLASRGCPQLEIYDEGWSSTKDTTSSFTPYIPPGYGVLVGKRTTGTPLGMYRYTINSHNGFKAGPYTRVINTFGADNVRPQDAVLEVHDGHNGGPTIQFPSTVKIIRFW